MGISVDREKSSEGNQTVTNPRALLASYEGRVPFRAVRSITGNTMKRILFAALLAFSTSALADDRTDEQKAADAWLSILSESYTFLRIGSDNCGLPDGEWLSARSRILVAALEYPRIDILKIERDLDRLYEDEKRRWGSECDERTRNMHSRALDTLDRYLASYQEAISKIR